LEAHRQVEKATDHQFALAVFQALTLAEKRAALQKVKASLERRAQEEAKRLDELARSLLAVGASRTADIPTEGRAAKPAPNAKGERAAAAVPTITNSIQVWAPI